MSGLLTRLRIFALEVALGAVVGALGLLQLVYGVPPLLSDPEMLRKFATSLITIGGTLLASGFFRFFFPMRLDATEDRIIGKLDNVSTTFMATIARMIPAGVANRPSDRHMAYRYLYWRTEDREFRPKWLRFSELTWKKQILPFLEADAVISQTEFADRHDYLLAMVELRGSVVIVATRFHAERAPHPEMAGIYIHAIPLVEEDQLFGCLRHMSMAGRQCLSPCIFSRTPLEMAELDRLWAEQDRGATCVHMNFPAHAGVPVPA